MLLESQTKDAIRKKEELKEIEAFFIKLLDYSFGYARNYKKGIK